MLVIITIELPNVTGIDAGILEAAMYAALSSLPTDDESDYFVMAESLSKGA